MLKEVKIEVTNLCYRNCKHCSSEATCSDDKHLFLDLDLIKRIVDEAHEMKAKSIAFTGGEATLHPSLIEAIKYAKKLGFKIKLYSMCYRTDENLKLLSDLNKNGLDEVIYSTAIPLVRGKDLSTYTIEEFLDKLVSSTALAIGFHHVVTNETMECINGLSNYLDKASPNLDKLSFLRYVPHGRGDEQLIPTKEEIETFKKYFLDLKEQYGNNIRIGSPFNILNISNTPCDAGDETMIVGFDGRVYPCDAMKYFDYFGSGGNIYNNSLREIYESKYFTDVRDIKDDHNEVCLKCQNYSICKSGCLGQKMIAATNLNVNKTFEWYEVNAKRTMNSFLSDEVMRLNAKMGLAGETGELIDCMKKLLTHNCSVEREETIKRLMTDEIGDVIWYIASSLSCYYHISFNEVGAHLLHKNNSKVKLVNQNMIKHCASQLDPDCPYAKTNRSHNLSKVDDLIREENKKIELSQFWEDLDLVSFKLRRTETREEIIKLSSELIVILGKICHQLLDITLEDVLTENIVRLQNRYPMGFDRTEASTRIYLEEIYKTDQMKNLSLIKNR